MGKIKEKLMKFMWGRYGSDKLNIALVIASMVFSMLGAVIDNFFVQIPCYFLLGWAIFRMMSRNIAARRAENAKFMGVWSKVEKWWKLQCNRVRDRKTHRYFACPSCKNTLRVPKGKGEITITCPVCKTKFDKKT